MHQAFELIKISNESFLSLQQVKQYLRVDHNYDDEYITDLIEVSLSVAENYLGISLKEAKWKLSLFDYIPSVIKLKKSPINAIESFKIFKLNGEAAYLNSNNYYFDQFNEELKMNNSLTVKRAEIIYLTGYKLKWLPCPIKQRMLEHIARMYDLRGNDNVLPLAARSLYQPYKKVRF